MGKGKSAVMAELMHRTYDRDEEPIYHLVGAEPSGTSKHKTLPPASTRDCSASTFFPEPREWERLDIATNLSDCLNISAIMI